MNLNGSELINALKQIQELGLIDSGIKVAVTFLHQSDARSIGAEALEGVQFAAPWFWTQDEDAREFGTRMMEITGNAPGWIAAGTYSAVSNYLNAVEKAGTDEPDAVLKVLHEMKIEDFFVQNSTMYPNGRLIHDMYSLQVKTPAEVQEKDDFFKLIATVPAKEAFKPYSDSVCTIGK